MFTLLNKKVYLHDTDATKSVYYSRYFDWFEEARMELLETNYLPLGELNKLGISFVPSKINNVEFKRPAFLGDKLTIRCEVIQFTSCSIVLTYSVIKDGKEICNALITMVCINSNGRPTKLPKELEELLNV